MTTLEQSENMHLFDNVDDMDFQDTLGDILEPIDVSNMTSPPLADIKIEVESLPDTSLPDTSLPDTVQVTDEPVVNNNIPDEVNEVAQRLKEYKIMQKQFKKDNVEIFKKNHRLNKLVKDTARELASIMQEIDCTKIVVDDMEIIMKKRTRLNHNMDFLEKNFGNESKLSEYKTAIEESKFDVVTRRHMTNKASKKPTGQRRRKKQKTQ
jgi:hypothetical protein